MYQVQKSFTVIELLVVLAVIALLASIILVSLSGTRDKAQIAKTLLYSNQIYHALGADIAGNWNFDEGSGTRANDSSGYYNTGTIYGASSTTDTPHKAAGQGSGKYALSFNGTSNYVNCGNGTSLDITTGSLTMEAWIKTTQTSNYPRIITKRVGANWYSLLITNGNLYIELASSYPTYYTAAIGTKIINNGNWYHVVGVRDTNTSKVRLYIDGSLDREAVDSTAGQTLSNSANLLIGFWDYYFNGLIDEVRVYSAALTAAEIQQHYAVGLKTHSNLALK